jgi:hypothetical protein
MVGGPGTTMFQTNRNGLSLRLRAAQGAYDYSKDGVSEPLHSRRKSNQAWQQSVPDGESYNQHALVLTAAKTAFAVIDAGKPLKFNRPNFNTLFNMLVQKT